MRLIFTILSLVYTFSTPFALAGDMPSGEFKQGLEEIRKSLGLSDETNVPEEIVYINGQRTSYAPGIEVTSNAVNELQFKGDDCTVDIISRKKVLTNTNETNSTPTVMVSLAAKITKNTGEKLTFVSTYGSDRTKFAKGKDSLKISQKTEMSARELHERGYYTEEQYRKIDDAPPRGTIWTTMASTAFHSLTNEALRSRVKESFELKSDGTITVQLGNKKLSCLT